MIHTVRIINEKTAALKEALDGVIAAQPGDFVRPESLYCHSLFKKDIIPDKVQIIIAGGGCTGSLFGGFVGEGLADAVCYGDFDCAPNAYTLYDIAKTVNRNKGVLFLANNFTGDFLNIDMAQELLQDEGIDSRACYVSDDLFSARGEPKENRGGLCGIGLLIKIAAGASKAGFDLNDLYRIVQKANDRLRSVTITLNGDLMEFGAGFSGEAPVIVKEFLNADDLVKNCLGYIMKELDYTNPKLYFTVNRFRMMSYMEGYIVLASVKKQLEALSHTVIGCSAGSYFDVFESIGCMISVLAADDELDRYLAPVSGYDFTI